MSSLFGKADPPKPKPVAPLPDPNSAEIREEQRNTAAELAASGRASTILTVPQLGGGTKGRLG